MQSELFTFFILNHEGHSRYDTYLTRAEADKKFAELVKQETERPEGEFVAYYCASVGGLVNSWRSV